MNDFLKRIIEFNKGKIEPLLESVLLRFFTIITLMVLCIKKIHE